MAGTSLCSRKVSWRLASGLMKKPEENVIRAREKTLRINNWKFNQDGFKDGMCVSVYVFVCMCKT